MSFRTFHVQNTILQLGGARVGPKLQFREKTTQCDWIALNHGLLSFQENNKLIQN